MNATVYQINYTFKATFTSPSKVFAVLSVLKELQYLKEQLGLKVESIKDFPNLNLSKKELFTAHIIDIRILIMVIWRFGE